MPNASRSIVLNMLNSDTPLRTGPMTKAERAALASIALHLPERGESQNGAAAGRLTLHYALRGDRPHAVATARSLYVCTDLPMLKERAVDYLRAAAKKEA